MTETEEIWKPIPSKPGYSASSLGRIRSESRMTPYKRSNVPGKILYYPTKQKLLKQTLDNGYLKTHLGWTHRLVCEAFHGSAPEGYEVNHIDENKQNNRPENLEWITHSENVLYGTGHLNRINSMKRTWKIRRLKNMDIAWPQILKILEIFS